MSSRGNSLSNPITNTRGRWIAVNRYIPLLTGLGFLILILESASCDASILYYLLSFQPHLVKGRVEGTAAADREWGVDGPPRKCRRIV